MIFDKYEYVSCPPNTGNIEMDVRTMLEREAKDVCTRFRGCGGVH